MWMFFSAVTNLNLQICMSLQFKGLVYFGYVNCRIWPWFETLEIFFKGTKLYKKLNHSGIRRFGSKKKNDGQKTLLATNW